jgi:alpha-D-ribose 1-methylphosphonate 5-triphosphate synthase subunit PhnG
MQSPNSCNAQPAPSPLTPAQQARRAWLAVLAQAPRAALEQALQAALPGGLPAYDWLRAPETGLTMVRGRVGGSGDMFNLGEATVTRATLRLRGAQAHSATVGVAYQLGRDKRRAELAALSDALLQRPELHDTVYQQVIAPLLSDNAALHEQQRRAAAATRVEFFTMVRGD